MEPCRFSGSTSGSDAINTSVKESINSNLESPEASMQLTDDALKLLNVQIQNDYINDNKLEATETTSLIKNKSKHTKNQWKLLILFPLLNFFLGACFSLQAPFFPMEAGLKGVSPSVYGLTIGIFHLVILTLSPIFGAYINATGAKFMINAGGYITAVSVFLFGFLDYIPNTVPFITLAFILRIAQGVGNAAFTTACYAIAAKEFPDNIAGIAASLQIGFAVGRIAGPAIGGLLFQAGGFVLPFAVIGGVFFLATIMATFVLPPMVTKIQSSFKVMSLLTKPSIAISTYQVIAMMLCYGFLTSTLEPHLRQFDLPPSLLGLMFVIDGITGSLANGFWGFIAKKKISLKLISSISGLFLAASFFLIGPAPFLPLPSTLWMVILCLVIIGLNLGGQVIIPYVDNNQEVIRIGYPKTIETFAVVSGLWNASVNLGAFIGSSVSGIMYDAVGFQWSTMLLVILQMIGFILSTGYYWITKLRGPSASTYVKEIV